MMHARYARHCSLESYVAFVLFCRTGQPIQLRLSKWTWKQLLNEPIGLEDLKEVDDEGDVVVPSPDVLDPPLRHALPLHRDIIGHLIFVVGVL